MGGKGSGARLAAREQTSKFGGRDDGYTAVVRGFEILVPGDEVLGWGYCGHQIEERIGGPGGFIRLNPRVDDLVGRVAVAHDGINLIVAGGITHGGAGCACPQAVLLRRLLEHVVTESDEAVLIDLEAGLEHLGRRSAHEVDAMLVVVDPSRAGLETARRIRRLAGEIGVASVLAVGNRIRGPADLDYLADGLDGLELVGAIPFSDDVIQAERAGRPVANLGGMIPEAVARLTDALVATTKVQVSS